MDVVRFGHSIRALRHRRGWRQADLAAAARVSQSVVARIALGLAGRMTVEKVEAVAAALGARIDLRLLWQGEGLDRLLDHDHATIVEVVARRLRACNWDVRTEVTFWIRGERGSVDILGWHAATRTVLVVEVKSVVPDIQAMLGSHDRKSRLGSEIARTVGWDAVVVGRLLVIGDNRTARRRIEARRETFSAALPDRFLQVRRFLTDPTAVSPLRGLIFLSASPHPTTRHRQSRTTKAA
jgi:transcriptional regulator with XRE-family HTH domain